jgi:hypothetical protein
LKQVKITKKFHVYQQMPTMSSTEVDSECHVEQARYVSLIDVGFKRNISDKAGIKTDPFVCVNLFCLPVGTEVTSPLNIRNSGTKITVFIVPKDANCYRIGM